MSDQSQGRIGALTAFSLNRRITILVMFVSILVVGAIATQSIPLELFPRGYTASSLRVVVPWQDAPPQEMLDKITLPLEEELSTVKGLEQVTSYTRTGQSRFTVQFKHGTDIDVAYREVRDRIERARLLFPDGVDRVFISKEDLSGVPVYVIGVVIDDELVDYYDLIQKQIVERFERVDGVAKVDTNGLEEKEIIIEVDRELAEGAGLNIYQLSQELGDDNFTLASGSVRDNGKKFLLRSVATYKSLADLENRMLRPGIRLKDVAKIRYEEAEKRYSVRVNSKTAVAVVILKEGEANTVEVSEKITAMMAEMESDPRLSGVTMTALFDQGSAVKESLVNLLDGGKIGGIFAALVLFFFLRRFRLTAIITLSIPLSLVIALITMFFIGETLNLLTILGLMICVGLLVDNSVVVAENIHRLHRDGMSRRDACIYGAGEIALAVIMATLTTVIVFATAGLVEGQAQFFLLRLAVPICVSLVASLFVALVFIPLCVYLTLPKQGKGKQRTWFTAVHERINAVLRGAYNQTFERINHGYTRLLTFFLRRRLDLVIILLLAFASVVVLFKQDLVKYVEQQEEDRTSFSIYFDLGQENNFDDTKAFFRDVEAVVKANQEDLGVEGYLVVHFSRSGRVQCWYDDAENQKLTAREAGQRLLELLPERAGVETFFGNEDENAESKDEATFTVEFEGEDAEQLANLVEQLTPVLERTPGVIGAKKTEDEAPNELALVVNRDRAVASGVNPQVIAGVVSYALRGSPLPRYNDDGREIPVRIRFQEEDRESLDALSSFAVPTDSGEVVAVSALTDAEMLQSPVGIFRKDKKMFRKIVLELEEDQSDETRERLNAVLAGLDLPEGINFRNQIGNSQQEDLKQLMLALLVANVLIYLLMGFLFESFVLPLSILLCIPAGFIGVSYGHMFAGIGIDFLGVVGTILLVGVVVNNGIVLIDYVNRLRERGLPRLEALLKATDRRFRPIVMTALTTIIGMIPLTISKPSSLGLSYKSFGITLIGGMSIATILTLLVVPVFYTLFDDLREIVGNVVKKAMGRAEGGRARQMGKAAAVTMHLNDDT